MNILIHADGNRNCYFSGEHIANREIHLFSLRILIFGIEKIKPGMVVHICLASSFCFVLLTLA